MTPATPDDVFELIDRYVAVGAALEHGLFWLLAEEPWVWGSEPAAAFVGTLGLWADKVPESGGERIEPVWIEEKVPYELSDVEVSRPSSRDLGSVLDEAGHDWDGAWLVQVPDAIGLISTRARTLGMQESLRRHSSPSTEFYEPLG